MSASSAILNPTALDLLKLWDIRGERPNEQVEVEVVDREKDCGTLVGRLSMVLFDGSSTTIEIKPLHSLRIDDLQQGTVVDEELYTLGEKNIHSIRVLPSAPIVTTQVLEKQITHEHRELNDEYPLLAHAHAIGLIALGVLASSYM